jgi:hypothetical protein
MTDQLPDWVAIAVAVAAFAVAGITLWIQLVDRRRADASSIEVYFDGHRGAAIVENTGTRSVYDVRVELKTSGAVTPLRSRRVFRIGPDGDEAFRPEHPIVDANLMGPDLLLVRADFSDWSGRRWKRTEVDLPATARARWLRPNGNAHIQRSEPTNSSSAGNQASRQPIIVCASGTSRNVTGYC